MKQPKFNSKNLLTNFGGLSAGFVVGMIVSILIYKLGKLIDPPPPEVNLENIRAITKFYSSHPVFLEFVIAGHVLGTFLGCFITSMMVKNHNVLNALIVGGLFLAVGLVDIVMCEHPTWFVIINTASYLPAAYLGGRLGRKTSPERIAPEYSKL